MLAPLFDIAPIADHLAAGGTIVTVNRRLARSALAAWGQHCRREGLRVWHQPPLQALDDWCAERWQDLLDRGWPEATGAGAIASPHAERWLWQQVIIAAGDAEDRDPVAFAELARTAWQQVERWQIPRRLLERSDHDGCRTLLRWHGALRRALAEHRLISREQALALVARGFRARALPTPTAIRLLGFQALPPLLLDVLSATNALVAEPATAPAGADCGAGHAVAFADDDDELRGAARWAAAQLAATPTARIGVVVPELTGLRARVERVFCDQFTPDHCLPGSAATPPPFNISAGIPLVRAPLVACALDLLALDAPTHPLPYYSSLLVSPFWGDAERELTLRARAEVLLRELGRVDLSPADFRAQLQPGAQAQPGDALTADPDPAARLRTVADRQRRESQAASLDVWRTRFAARLQLLGWPGARSLDSTEYQQWQHWQQLLDEFAALAPVAGAVTAPQALSQLRQMAAAAVFQPQTADAPIQVLGVLEAAGLRFDRLWVAGMDAARWPPPAAPNPLLPIALQRQYRMPRASAGQELALAQAQFASLRTAAPQVIFSHAHSDGDGERLPSALVRDLPPWPGLTEAVAPAPWQPLVAALADTASLQSVPIGPAPPLPHTNAVFAGGSGVLRDQAGCPFNAFAIWRLGATALPEPVFGLSAADRGTLLHRCLELLWTRLRTRGALLALDAAATAALVAEVVAAALQPWRQRRADLFGPRFVRIESARLCNLLATWLDLERQRDDFAVLAPEQALTVVVAGLRLALRIDRIDRLADGSLVLIDYKTGDTTARVWAGARPEEPQLPLYALGQSAPVAALCLARLSARAGVAICGTGRDPTLIAGLIAPAELGLPAPWPDTLAHWRRALEALAREFVDGCAELAFHTRTAAEYQGHLLALNRWPEWPALRARAPGGAKP